MTDILIKNMELPKNDEVLSLTVYPNGSVCLFMKEVSKAIELPPHGPLADLNKIKDKFRIASRMCEATNKLERAKHWRDAEGLVNESEVILESTEKVEETT